MLLSMRWSEIGETRCSIARTLSVVGDRWTLLIIRESFLGARRFDAFQERLGAPRRILSERLKRLVERGILKRVQYLERPPRFEYRLTDKGVDLYPVISSLRVFGDKNLPHPDGPPVEEIHERCGHVVQPILACPECGEPIHAKDMRARISLDDSDLAPLGARGRGSS